MSAELSPTQRTLNLLEAEWRQRERDAILADLDAQLDAMIAGIGDNTWTAKARHRAVVEVREWMAAIRKTEHVR